MKCGCNKVAAYEVYAHREPHCLSCGAEAMNCSVRVPALPIDQWGDPMLFEPIEHAGREYEVVSDTSGDVVAYRDLGNGRIELLDLSLDLPMTERFNADNVTFRSLLVQDYHICLILGHYHYSRDIAVVEAQEKLNAEHIAVIEGREKVA